jgi:hypothetical protein
MNKFLKGFLSELAINTVNDDATTRSSGKRNYVLFDTTKPGL